MQPDLYSLLAPALPVLLAIGTVGGFAVYIKLSLESIRETHKTAMESVKESQRTFEARVTLVESQMRDIANRQLDLQAKTVQRLTRIETMLSALPCVASHSLLRTDNCDELRKHDD